MRFLPNGDADRSAMLAAVGATDFSDLFADVPESCHLQPGALKLPPAQSEAAIVRRFAAAAARNQSASDHACFLGGGTYHHFIPAAVDYVISRGEFLTAYTPYQPEISQGTLQVLFEYQTMAARLLGMEVSNASLYDVATAVAEAALMSSRITRRKKVLVSAGVNPRYRQVTANYLSRLNLELVEAPIAHFATDPTALAALLDKQCAALIVQYPDFYGSLYDLTALRQACNACGALLVVACADPTLFGLLTPPGEFGADIVVASGQSLGIPMGYGGPHLGIFTCKQQHLRQMPGRVCGMSRDSRGRRGFVLTLSTREQHIRREKATSNICSNQGLMTTAAATYLTLLGDHGLKQVAERSLAALQLLVSHLPASVQASSGPRGHETVLTFATPQKRDAFLTVARSQKIFAGIPLEKLTPDHGENHLLVATTEMVEESDITRFIHLLEVSA